MPNKYSRPKRLRKCDACGAEYLPPVSRSRHCSVVCRFWSKVKKAEGCWEWQGAIGGPGYGSFGVGTKRWEASHRMVWKLTHGDPPAGMYVMHKCDNRKCCNPDHLMLGTPADNVLDMHAKGRQTDGSNNPRGEKQWKAKLNDSVVREIRALRPNYSLKQLAERFDVSQSVISSVVLGKTWRHVA